MSSDSELHDLRERAKSFALAGEWGATAIEINTRMLEIDDRAADAYTRLARCFREQGRLAAVREMYMQVLTFDSHNVIARNNLAKIEKELGRADELRSVASIGSFDEAFAVGGAARKRTRYALAVAALARAVELRPGSVHAWNALGAAYRHKGALDQARSAYEHALDLARNEAKMDTQAELQHIQSLLLDRISSAVSNRDVAAVAALSSLAKECEALNAEFASLNRRVEAAKSALNGSWSSSTTSQKLPHSAEAPPASPKAAGAQARSEWVAGLRAQGISLHGHRKRYQAARGQSVAVAFANELPDAENRWFLGLADEPTEVAVLLCKSLTGKLHDIVLPVSHLREVWRVLSRHKSEVKFNVKKAASRFLLLVPRNEPLDVTRYVGNYEPLR